MASDALILAGVVLVALAVGAWFFYARMNMVPNINFPPINSLADLSGTVWTMPPRNGQTIGMRIGDNGAVTTLLNGHAFTMGDSHSSIAMVDGGYVFRGGDGQVPMTVTTNQIRIRYPQGTKTYTRAV